MAKDLKGFLKIKRLKGEYRPVCERVKDYGPVFISRKTGQAEEQACRCMDCGTPFCHWGCPVGNYIPEWNEKMMAGDWARAFALLDATNNLPEITGRVCPAPCEYACVLGLNDDPVTIRENEFSIIEQAFKSKTIKPQPPKKRTGKKVAVIGAGPAGLSCAAQLNRAGHRVTVFEKDEKLGGIMRYGIPDFKLEKSVLDRRINLWQKEGVIFKTGTKVTARPKGFDAVVLAGGSRVPRDLAIKGRELKGINFAMDYLVRSNKTKLPEAQGKKVVVIGGGDTGSDCVGTANRQGAACVVQVELLPMPSEARPASQPWPKYPLLLKTSTSHEEGAERKWSILTKEFKGQGSRVKALKCVRVDDKLKEIPGTEFEIEADLVLLALGFLHPEHNGLLDNLGVQYDQRGNVKTDGNYMTSKRGVFSAGDMRRGQSLIVWAIAEGRCCAYFIDAYLMGRAPKT